MMRAHRSPKCRAWRGVAWRGVAWRGVAWPAGRRRVLKTYPYAIVYAIEPEEILILAVEHMKRRPATGCVASRAEAR
jgi:plasmid stabilization system protein ParE